MMNGKKPSPWGTGLVFLLAALTLIDPIRGTVEHGRTGGFSHIELGILAALALCGVALIIFALLEDPSSNRPTKWWEYVLIAIVATAGFFANQVLVQRILRGEVRSLQLLGDSWAYVWGSAFLGWGISRFRKARAMDHSSGPDPTRQDVAAGR
jgi:hypothetical protein